MKQESQRILETIREMGYENLTSLDELSLDGKVNAILKFLQKQEDENLDLKERIKNAQSLEELKSVIMDILK